MLEIDSTEHHLSPEDHTKTLECDQQLQAAGYVVLHVKPRQLPNASRFVQLVAAWLDAVAHRSSR